MSPRASTTCDVVIPARNAEPYIGAAIESLLAQTRPPSRIIVVDDSSTDRTAEIAASYGRRVRLVEGSGRGSGSARNLGVRQAVNPLIAFLDADDVCRPDRLARQVDAMQEAPDAVMAFCDADYIDADGAGTGVRFNCPEFTPRGFLGLMFERNRVLTTSVAMVRRSAFDQVGGFDECLSPAEEYDLWLRLALIGRVVHVPELLVSYRLHAHNISHNREALRLCERDSLRKHPVRRIRAALRGAYGCHRRADLALASVLFRMERYAEGSERLDAIEPDTADRALHAFLRGNFAVRRGQLDDAASHFQRCLACDPSYAAAHNNLGAIIAARGLDADAAVHFTTAARLRPGYSDPRQNLRRLRSRAGDWCLTLSPLRPVLRPG